MSVLQVGRCDSGHVTVQYKDLSATFSTLSAFIASVLQDGRCGSGHVTVQDEDRPAQAGEVQPGRHLRQQHFQVQEAHHRPGARKHGAAQ